MLDQKRLVKKKEKKISEVAAVDRSSLYLHCAPYVLLAGVIDRIYSKIEPATSAFCEYHGLA